MGFETLEDYHAQWTTIGDSHVDPQLRPKFKRMMEEDGMVADFEGEVKCKDGTTMWFSEYSRAVYDDDGKIVAYEGTMVDVTERKRLERERIDMIRERERAKVETLRRFTGEAAHDLLTPLTTMITSLYLLRRTTSDQGQLKRIETLERHTGHIHQSVNALLKMTRLNRSTFDIQAVALNALVADVIAQQKSLAEGKHIALNFEPDQVVNHFMIDREEMAFALRQVIANAMAYSENGQTISIRTAMRDSQAVIIVIDQGRGIKPDDLPFVFEPFFRSQERDTSKGGVGLGLTIAQWIVNAHGGQIAVQSEVGAGSTVTISPPLISAEV
jgi:signal transduction histidine kinase